MVAYGVEKCYKKLHGTDALSKKAKRNGGGKNLTSVSGA